MDKTQEILVTNWVGINQDVLVHLTKAMTESGVLDPISQRYDSVTARHLLFFVALVVDQFQWNKVKVNVTTSEAVFSAVKELKPPVTSQVKVESLLHGLEQAVLSDQLFPFWFEANQRIAGLNCVEVVLTTNHAKALVRLVESMQYQPIEIRPFYQQIKQFSLRKEEAVC